MKGTLLVLVTLICVVLGRIATPSEEFRKSLQGPPSEFSDMALPTPQEAALRADSALMEVFMLPSRNGDSWSWETVFPVDSDDEFTLAVLSPFEKDLTLYLLPPGETVYTKIEDSLFAGEQSIGKKTVGPFGIDGQSASATSYTFFNSRIGDWKIKVDADKDVNPSHPGLPQAYLIVENKSNYKLYSYLNSFNLVEDEEIGLVVQMYEETEIATSARGSKAPAPLRNSILKAKMIVILPDGNEVVVEMQDDGLHADQQANDDIYGALIEAEEVGTYVAKAEIYGVTPQGHNFYRSSSHLIEVSKPSATLTGLGSYVYDKESQFVTFNIDVDTVDDDSAVADGLALRAYAEVYGTDSSGHQYVPVGWAAAIVDVQDLAGKKVVELDLHENWFIIAKASPPFQLRSVTLQDKDSNSILSFRSEIFVQAHKGSLSMLLARLQLAQAKKELASGIKESEMMRYGPRPSSWNNTLSYHQEKKGDNAASVSASSGKLLLVHGYCSSSVWNVNSFTNAVEFKDFGQSRSNDEFALLIRKFGEPYESYSIAAHSQGGLASTHLKTYYWSGLDNVGPGRKIQSVGSPYSGCSLSGTLASIGWLFGFGCGSNFDLSTSGGALWLSKIPPPPQKDVYYYTTMYSDDWWIWSACVTGSSMVLYSPNDGTSEKIYSTLPYGNNMGVTKGYCHVSGMSYPPQTYYSGIVTQINNNAAR